jgi:acetolactate synthase I/II/III large subunit
MTATDRSSVAEWIARFLQGRGVDRIFGLQGGHIQPIWDWLGRLGVRIVDVRDEGAAVHMAQAHAELTGGFAVAMATAGPGVTNCVTAMANADLSRAPVLLIGGCPPRPQVNMGPLQDIDHAGILRPVTRVSRTLRVPEQVIREMDAALALMLGDGGMPGPAYLEIPTDVLRQEMPRALILGEWMAPKRPRRPAPDAEAVAEAVEAIWGARRPSVVTGLGARGAGAELRALLDATGAVYLDTQESRGLVPGDHPAVVGAMRAQVMAETDLVVLVGRRLDYQLGYGSPAVFPKARFVRIAATPGELADNRRGQPELMADPALALAAIVEKAGNRAPATERDWSEGLRKRHRERVDKGAEAPLPETRDGKIHPIAIFRALADVADPDHLAVADGGDLLSFARVGLTSRHYMDSGTFGCLGVGVPYAIAAALHDPSRQVIVATGDGAFGFNAMEIDTAVRHGAKIVVIVSNNAAWNIERYDQEVNYGGRVVGTTLGDADYAALARALGAHGERVTDAAELPAAIRRAIDNAPAVVDVVTSQDAVSSDATKGLGFVPDYQALTPWNDAELARRR